jgi:hypothetical protein
MTTKQDFTPTEWSRSLSTERMTMSRGPFAAFAAISFAGGALLAGCGTSSKPAYCSQVTNFKDSIKTLEQVE